ncbi:uncharacterized protein LTR77_007987 [Saxophila tyrrhenica]|uniref:CCHC-type domain-containing protein n=1 Tax=Saxophila tyrrhenica TaxID=1690608 RepID=A0AAV9P227_9PEZI|nr:hypothetical protein LTR77_007987 [Saxophila tyrrhenica]
MAQTNKQGKEMSSRLATMKFMQRSTGSPSSPRTPDQPSGKRQRMSNGSYNSTPASTDAQRVEEAIATEERKRAEIAEREAAGRGETKWYLSFKEPPVSQQSESPLRIVSAGYSALDAAGRERSSEDEGEEDSVRRQMQGRRSFGKFNRKLEKQQKSYDAESSSSSESEDEDEEESDEDDPTGSAAMIAQSRREAGDKARAERKAKRKAEQEEAEVMAGERRKKQIKLNSNPQSISSGGGKLRAGGGNTDQACFKCGQKGHLKRDCPQ